MYWTACVWYTSSFLSCDGKDSVTERSETIIRFLLGEIAETNDCPFLQEEIVVKGLTHEETQTFIQSIDRDIRKSEVFSQNCSQGFQRKSNFYQIFSRMNHGVTVPISWLKPVEVVKQIFDFRCQGAYLNGDLYLSLNLVTNKWACLSFRWWCKRRSSMHWLRSYAGWLDQQQYIHVV